MDRVYVVVGECGEYSDHTQWSVRAFASEAEAQEFQTACETFARGYTGEHYDYQARDAYFKDGPDPGIGPSSTGTTYSIDTVPFGAESTALSTAPIRLRNTGRLLSLQSEE